MKTVSEQIVEEIKTHILCSISFFENRAADEVMWKNIVQPDRQQLTIRSMRIGCWIPKAINTHTKNM
jgi:hypothetical protein